MAYIAMVESVRPYAELAKVLAGGAYFSVTILITHPESDFTWLQIAAVRDT